jgi:hypothetical protein
LLKKILEEGRKGLLGIMQQEDKKRKVGYTFKKHLYDAENITSAEVTFEIPFQDVTWHELMQEFQNFVRASGFSPPKGDLVWLEEDEAICKKAEKVLYNKNSSMY